MMPRPFQPDVVQRRLASLARIRGELQKVEGLGKQQLESDRTLLYGVFYMLQQTVELATEINQHIAKSALGIAEMETTRGFDDLIHAGILPQELRQDFRRSAALRNIIAHQYTDVDLDIVVQAVPRAIAVYEQYAQCITDWVDSQLR